MADNYFLQFDVNQVNKMAQSDYEVNSQRLGGIFDRAKASSNLHNKLFYQVSTMVAALGAAMAYKGYDMKDLSLTTVTEQLKKIMTVANMGVYSTTSQMMATIAAALTPYSTTSQMNAAISAALPNMTYYYTKSETVAQINTALASYVTVSSFKIEFFSRQNNSSGSQTFTGAGFRPHAVIAIFYNNNSGYNGGSVVGIGFKDSNNQMCVGVATQNADEETNGGLIHQGRIISGGSSKQGISCQVMDFGPTGMTVTWEQCNGGNNGTTLGAFLYI